MIIDRTQFSAQRGVAQTFTTGHHHPRQGRFPGERFLVAPVHTDDDATVVAPITQRDDVDTHDAQQMRFGHNILRSVRCGPSAARTVGHPVAEPISSSTPSGVPGSGR